MSNLTLKVSCDAGTRIEKAFTEACDLARRLQISVEFDFNGVTCICFPNGIPDTGVIRYREAVKPDVKYKIAIANNELLEAVNNG